MWLSEQFAAAPAAETPELGEVTAGAERAAVKSAGQEKRLLPVLSPGGYAWSPSPGARKLPMASALRTVWIRVLL